MVYSTNSSDRRVHKPGIDTPLNRRRRNETTIQLRKSKKAEGLLRRRMVTSTSTKPSKDKEAVMLPTFLSKHNVNLSDEAIGLIVKMDGNYHQPNNPVRYSPSKIDSPLNETSEVEKLILNSGVVPLLLSSLSSHNTHDTREQSALCLGNIAAESRSLRDYMLKLDAMQTLLSNMIQSMDHNQIQLLEKIVWSISSICRGKSKPNSEQIVVAIPHLCNLLRSSAGDIFRNSLWALNYMSETSDEIVLQEIDSADIYHILVSTLGMENQDSSLNLASLRILSNFVLANNCHIPKFFRNDSIEHFSRLLTSANKEVCIEALFLLSYIAEGGGHYSIDLMLSSPTFMPVLAEISKKAPLDLKVEALWVIGNIAGSGSEEHLKKLVHFGIIPLLCQNDLKICDPKTILMGLDAIDEILIAGERLGEDYRIKLDEHDGLDMIESLQAHVNDSVYRRAVELIDSHFGTEDDSDYSDWDEGRSW